MSLPSARRLLIVGNPRAEHVGAHLLAAAAELHIEARIADIRDAWPGNVWWRRFHHRVLGRRPTALRAFGAQVIRMCGAFTPHLVLTTGIAPVSAAALREIANMGIRSANFSTDDPWNPANGARFFWDALRRYDTIYTPRRANIRDLERHGCRAVRYLPFAYNPLMHFVETVASSAERERFACDLAFIGGADAERYALVERVLDAGIATNLYGGFWDRWPRARPHYKGIVFGRDLRLAVAGATVHLCMGRAANRDGHAMRSFELPAMGACMVVEATDEHRELFGPPGECVVYYERPEEIPARVQELLSDAALRERLKAAARARICAGTQTYAARLAAIFESEGL